MAHLKTVTPRLACALALLLGTVGLSAPAQSSDSYQLPTLGGASTSVSNEEYRLGRAWLRQFRAHAPQWQDPIVNDYLESLVARLAPHSQLGNLQTTTVMVDNRSLNAFAVPGGVVGIRPPG